MSFKVVVDGETVHEIDDKRVTMVHVFTKNGESGTIRINAEMTEMVLDFEYAPPGVLMLDDVDVLKPGYRPNQTEDDIEELEEKLAEVRPSTNEGADQFTNEAIEEKEKAAEAAAKAEQEESAPKPEVKAAPKPAVQKEKTSA